MPRCPNDIRDPLAGSGVPQVLLELTEAVRLHEACLEGEPVSNRVEPGRINAHLAAHYDLERAHPLEEVTRDVFDILSQGMVHPNHPRHFGLFVPGVRPAGVIADALVALLNPQLGAWWYAPAACEIESFVLEACAAKLGFDRHESCAHFTSGGSEANLTAVVLALTEHFPEYSTAGLAGCRRRPVLYLSAEAHDCFVKIAQMTGLGRSAIRRVHADAALGMDLDDLRRQYQCDKDCGFMPFLIVATAGTTASGAFDPLSALVEFKRETGLWLHVDAAWGGLALLLDEHRSLLDGINQADSVTWDAHKVLPLPMGAGMLFARRRAGSAAAFAVETGYLPASRPGTIDLYRHSVQWSRRFMGLKVFLTLADLGWEGVRSLLRHVIRVAQVLRDELERAGFRIVNQTPLPLVCFTHQNILSGRQTADEIVNALVSEGRVWISSVSLSPREPKAIRACITNHRTSPEDAKFLGSELVRVL